MRAPWAWRRVVRAMTNEKLDLDKAADTLQAADASVADVAEEYRQTGPVRVISLLSEVGDQPQMRSLCGALLVAGLARRDRRMASAGLRMLASHELATAVKDAIKHRVDRTRPRAREEAEDAHKMRPGNNHAKEETSFPSGHSAGAASTARAFAREYPEHAGAAYAAAGSVALAQIPRCAHYPTDVGAGLSIGIAAEAAVDAVWRLLARAVRRA